MRRSMLFVVAVALMAAMAGPASANGVGFASSSPTGTVTGLYETLDQSTCLGSDGDYLVRVRGIGGFLGSTAPGVSGNFESELIQVTRKATGDGMAFAFMAGENPWGADWFGIAAFVADLPTLKGGMIGFGEYNDTLVANLSGRWKSGNRIELAFGGSPATPNLGVEMLGDDCGALVFGGLGRMATKLAPELAGTDAGRQLARIGQRARAVAARPAPSRISTVSDFSMQLGSATSSGGWGGSLLDTCPGDDTDYYTVGTGFEGGLTSSFDDFGGGFGGEALQFVRADNRRGMVIALMGVDDGVGNAWEGFALAVVHGQKVRGVGFFMKDSVDPAVVIANLTARFRDDGSYTLGFGDGSLALNDFAFATQGTDCGFFIIPT